MQHRDRQPKVCGMNVVEDTGGKDLEFSVTRMLMKLGDT